jgi:hypothetical protein
MKSWISTSLVKCTDVVVAVGGVVLCSCFLFPVSEACSIAVGGTISDCTHSEHAAEKCKKHPDTEGSCVDEYLILKHLTGNLKDHAYGSDEDVCKANNCKSDVKPRVVSFCNEIPDKISNEVPVPQ